MLRLRLSIIAVVYDEIILPMFDWRSYFICSGQTNSPPQTFSLLFSTSPFIVPLFLELTESQSLRLDKINFTIPHDWLSTFFKNRPYLILDYIPVSSLPFVSVLNTTAHTLRLFTSSRNIS
jgi:hypothetical protein